MRSLKTLGPLAIVVETRRFAQALWLGKMYRERKNRQAVERIQAQMVQSVRSAIERRRRPDSSI